MLPSGSPCISRPHCSEVLEQLVQQLVRRVGEVQGLVWLVAPTKTKWDKETTSGTSRKKNWGRILPRYFGKWGNESVAAGLMNFVIAKEWFVEDRSTSKNCNVMSRGRSSWVKRILNFILFPRKNQPHLSAWGNDDFHKLDKQQQFHHIPSKRM